MPHPAHVGCGTGVLLATPSEKLGADSGGELDGDIGSLPSSAEGGPIVTGFHPRRSSAPQTEGCEAHCACS
jgi:hypothetical protein